MVGTGEVSFVRQNLDAHPIQVVKNLEFPTKDLEKEWVWIADISKLVFFLLPETCEGGFLI